MKRLATLRDNTNDMNVKDPTKGEQRYSYFTPCPATLTLPRYKLDSIPSPRVATAHPPRNPYSPPIGRRPQPTRITPATNYVGRRHPSDRESKIMALRDRVKALENELRMHSFPYQNEEEELYHESLGYYSSTKKSFE